MAIAAPRWLVDTAESSVLIENRFGEPVVGGLRARGHRVVVAPSFDPRMGHAQAILVAPSGFAATSDPRCEGLAPGF